MIWANNPNAAIVLQNSFAYAGFNHFTEIDSYREWSIEQKYDDEKNVFVEPFLPNERIGIIHLAAGIWKDNKDMRLNKDIKIEV